MQIKNHELQGHLKQQLLPLYLLSGDDPFLREEARLVLRQHCQELGYAQRLLYGETSPTATAAAFRAALGDMSLFGPQELLLELSLSGAPGKPFDTLLPEYLEDPPQGVTVVILCPRLDAAAMRKSWFAKLAKGACGLVRIWPIDARNFPQWLRQRFQQAGLRPDPEAVRMLAELTTGNPGAAVQEIHKLRLVLGEDAVVDARTVLEGTTGQSRASLYDLWEQILQGNAPAAMGALWAWRDQGGDAFRICWFLAHELHVLLEKQEELRSGRPESSVVPPYQRRNSRVFLAALRRWPTPFLERMLQRSWRIEAGIKGQRPPTEPPAAPWREIDRLVLALVGRSLAAPTPASRPADPRARKSAPEAR